MAFLQQLGQGIRPISNYYNLATSYSKGSNNLLRGVLPANSSIYSRSTSTLKPKSKEESLKIAKKRHSDAERRRRLRINCQYATLRSILPNLVKMDKASVLGETVKHVTELQRSVKKLEASGLGCLLPSEENNLNLNYCHGGDTTTAATSTAAAAAINNINNSNSSSLMKIVFNCQDRVGMISDLTAAVKAEKGRVVRAEMTTVGGRTRVVLWIQGFKGKEGILRLRAALKVVLGRPNLITAAGSNRKYRLNH